MARFGSIVLCLLWATAVLGQAPAKLAGKVLDGEGIAVVGANVVLESAVLKEGKAGTVTDDEGSFSFASLPAGRYLIKVSHLGYSELVRAGIQVAPGGQLVLDLTLKDAILLHDTRSK